MDLTTDTVGDVVVVSLRGRLDGVTAAETERQLSALIDAEKHRLVLDLAELAYVSSAGLRTFLSTAKRLNKVEGALALCAVRPVIHDLFVLSGLSTIFKIVTTQADAIAAVS